MSSYSPEQPNQSEENLFEIIGREYTPQPEPAAEPIDPLDRIAQAFSYHPPETQWRQDAHNRINDAAFEFAKTFVCVCPDVTEVELDRVVQFIQMARMQANLIVISKEVQGITDEDMKF